MKNYLNRLVAMLLTAVLVMSELTVPVYAVEQTGVTVEKTGTEETAVGNAEEKSGEETVPAVATVSDDTLSKDEAVKDEEALSPQAETGESTGGEDDALLSENDEDALAVEPEDPDALAGEKSSDGSTGRGHVRGYIRAPHEDEYDSPVEDGEGDELFGELPSFYVSDAVQGKRSRSQGRFGTCWAFGTMSAVELSAAQTKVGNKNTDLSELHLAYFAGKGVDVYDPLHGLDGDNNAAQFMSDGGYDSSETFLFGGTSDNSAHLMASWIGAADENKYPYGSAGGHYNTSNKNNMDDALHLKNYYVVDPSNSKNRNALKNLIVNYGGATISYWAADEAAKYGDDYEGLTEDHVLNRDNNCYYTPEEMTCNHEVCVVGWDDDFSVDNFTNAPAGDGAWLIRNSWEAGNTVDDEGNLSRESAAYNSYFWLSYYDKSIANSSIAFEMEPANDYDHNYQYDGCMTSGWCTGTKFANIFKAGSDETLKSVYFATYSASFNYTVDIYTGVQYGKPTSGDKVATKSGKIDYAGGHTIELNEDVYLSKGEMFSVVVTVPSSTRFDLEQKSDEVYITTAYSETGRSLYYTGGKWKDTKSLGNGFGDARIKAFTVNGNKLKSYTLTLDANGGKLENGKTTDTQTVTYGRAYGELPEPVKEGYEFDGWYTAKDDSGEQVTATTKYTYESNSTVYAHWTAKTITVTLSANGGKFGTKSSIKKTVTFDQAYGKWDEVPTMTGYDFAGWFTEPNDGEGTEIDQDTIVKTYENHTIYAHWMNEIYEVDFDPNFEGAIIIPYYIKYGDTLGEGTGTGKLPVVLRDGATLKGWYTLKSGGTKVTEDTKVTKSVTYYAQWAPGKYTVTFDPNGGTCKTESKLVTMDTKYGTLPTPTKEGKTFDGWYTAADGGNEVTAQTTFTFGKDQTLYAHWVNTPYQVTFDAMDGVCAISSKTVRFSEKYDTLPAPTKTGYDFKGWWTEASGGTAITKDSVVETAGNHTLYAHWNPVKVKVTFENICTKDVDYKTKYGQYFEEGKFPVATRNDHDFLGWFTEREGGTRITADSIISIPSTHTLYAHWASRKIGDDTAGEGDISGEKFWIRGVEDRDYTSSAIRFDDLRVYCGSRLLTKDVDYTLSYKNNTNAYIFDEEDVDFKAAKAPTVTITGKGNYSGKITKTFKIKQLRLDTGKAYAPDISLPGNGKVQKGTTTVYYRFDDGRTITLKKGTDYYYPDNAYNEVYVDPGTYDVTIEGKGNYIGKLKFKETILDKTDTYHMIGKATIKIVKSKDATGEEIKPEGDDLVVTSKKGSDTLILTKGVDYDVEYRNNVLPGTATVIIKGRDPFFGTKTATFKINGISISKATISLAGSASYSTPYTGAPIKLEDKDVSLSYIPKRGAAAEALDAWDANTRPIGHYTVDGYTNNINAGKNKAYVNVSGHGKFTGTTKKAFTITPVSLASDNVGAATGNVTIRVADAETGIPEVKYQKGGSKPKVEVIFHGLDTAGKPKDYTLSEGKDYTLSFKNNNVVANTDPKKIPLVTITGKGNFTGKCERQFGIVGGSLEDVTFTADDVVYKNKVGNFVTKVKVTDTNGKALVANTDYEKNVVYLYESIPDGTKVVNKRGEIRVDTEKIAEFDALGQLIIADPANDIAPVGAVIVARITGKNNYYDNEKKIDAKFRIVKSPISSASVKIRNQVYTGNRINIGYDDIQVKSGKYELDPGDYEIDNTAFVNINKGTGKVVLRGKGNFGGTKTVTFKITNRAVVR